MNREPFFNIIKVSLFKKFTVDQVRGLDTLLDVFARYPKLSIQDQAYMLATVYHECAGKMLPIEEYGKGKGRKYGSRIDINGSRYSNALPIYYGRGYVQLTWLTNYVKAKNKLGIDFVNKPELALVPENAAKIMILGMTEGWFTGKKLSDYITPTKADYVGARRIINGTDKAQLIASYAVKFEAALKVIA